MKQKDEKLWLLVDEILWNDWDPIGVNDSEQARNEYHSYISTIVRLIMSNSDGSNLAKHLHQLRSVSIGLSENFEVDQRVAQKLIKESKNLL